ncbi:hypothetical protein GQ43DRAFT_409564 [Delitschia confertaspora ATCC 74209]|uniref:Transcription factor IIIC subunit 5 HTH domain-containing protein n=1 Tax=Delitschia confertaspora ATCC 74209 TaxID=1513339 RepID=A0A9P4JXQ9_9PLEO|nr:hypothetical protein GQ43DRAFT_409564 [Delitschia confertaspora ATCC 74209]
MATPSPADYSTSRNKPDRNKSKTAPWLLVPAQSVMSVEHPCIIKDVDKGIKSLGGEVKSHIQALIERKNIAATLRPDDPFAKHIMSSVVRTENLLLKISVPKRTGRRRKRGTNGPFLTEQEISEQSGSREPNSKKTAEHGNSEQREKHGIESKKKVATPSIPYVDAETVFRSLRDNATKYTVTPVGIIDQTHRFRNLPDLQITNADNRIMQGIRDHLMPLKYSEIKKYEINTEPGIVLSPNIGPPVQFLQTISPIAYSYKQNPGVKFETDETGESRALNTHKRLFVDSMYIVHADDPTVPQGPKPDLPPEDRLTYLETQILTELRALLQERPVVTRHVIYNRLGWSKRDKLRDISAYAGYFFDTGPFREALVRYGIDPRKDPEMRKYQTLSYMTFRSLGPKSGRTFYENIKVLVRMRPEELTHSHMFDGMSVSRTGNMFQMCDITDPVIRKILDTPNIRSTCAPTTQGWYHSGTWTKAVTVLKDKVNLLLRNEIPDNSVYDRLVAWPDIFTSEGIYETYVDEVLDTEIHREKKREHALMSICRRMVKNPRYAIEIVESGGLEAEGAQDGQARDKEGDIPIDADVDAEADDQLEEDEDEVIEGPDAEEDEIANEDEDESEGLFVSGWNDETDYVRGPYHDGLEGGLYNGKSRGREGEEDMGREEAGIMEGREDHATSERSPPPYRGTFG